MIQFKEYLLLAESFDKPYDKEENNDISNDERKQIAKIHDVHDFREYHIKTDDLKFKHRMTVFKQKGAYEIHHDITPIDDNDDKRKISGEMVGNKPNPRYVATMLTHAKTLLDTGHSVRIVGHKDNGMFDHYHKIGKILAKKHNLHMSESSSYSDTSKNPKAKDFKEYTLTKNE